MSETTTKTKPQTATLDDVVLEWSKKETKVDRAYRAAFPIDPKNPETKPPHTLDEWRQRWIRLVIVPREKEQLEQQLKDKAITQQQYEKKIKALVK